MRTPGAKTVERRLLRVYYAALCRGMLYYRHGMSFQGRAVPTRHRHVTWTQGASLLRYNRLIASISRARVVQPDDGNFVRSHGFPILFAPAIDYIAPVISSLRR